MTATDISTPYQRSFVASHDVPYVSVRMVPRGEWIPLSDSTAVEAVAKQLLDTAAEDGGPLPTIAQIAVVGCLAWLVANNAKCVACAQPSGAVEVMFRSAAKRRRLVFEVDRNGLVVRGFTASETAATEFSADEVDLHRLRYLIGWVNGEIE